MLQLDKAIGEALILTGVISTVRGAYEFQGRRFDILRDGRIQFPGLVEINPLLGRHRTTDDFGRGGAGPHRWHAAPTRAHLDQSTTA